VGVKQEAVNAALQSENPKDALVDAIMLMANNRGREDAVRRIFIERVKRQQARREKLAQLQEQEDNAKRAKLAKRAGKKDKSQKRGRNNSKREIEFGADVGFSDEIENPVALDTRTPQEKLRDELEAMRVVALQQRAAVEGVDDDAWHAAMDTDTPKQELIRLIMVVRFPPKDVPVTGESQFGPRRDRPRSIDADELET
jgi:hypothetical protein